MYNPQLETFITVAESGSFAKAADKLYISPTAVIKQINILESNLDIKLFNRTHRGLTLTAAGKSLYSDARYIIRYSHESLERAKNAMQKENGNNLLMAVPTWRDVHPLLKIIPVDWNFTMPFGLLHSPQPASHVQKCINAITRIYKENRA